MWQSYVHTLTALLRELSVTDITGSSVTVEGAFTGWAADAVRIAHSGGIHFIGNGASAAMASHCAADITKNCGIRAMVFTDPALATALANDHGVDDMFVVALERYAATGDLLIAISSSGRSPNILNACRAAMDIGVNVVTLSGKDLGNPLRRLGRLNFYVPAASYSLVESAHAAILHHWIDRVEATV